MDYTTFQNAVQEAIDPVSFARHAHLLPGVQSVYFHRFLHTLSLGFSVPEAILHIDRAQKLPDKNYYRYINYFRMIREFETA